MRLYLNGVPCWLPVPGLMGGLFPGPHGLCSLAIGGDLDGSLPAGVVYRRRASHLWLLHLGSQLELLQLGHALLSFFGHFFIDEAKCRGCIPLHLGKVEAHWNPWVFLARVLLTHGSLVWIL